MQDDVDWLIKLLKFAAIGSHLNEVHSNILHLFLTHTDKHIAAMAFLFRRLSPEHRDIETTILEAANLSDTAKKIVVHAIRTATNIVNRDVKSLADAMKAHPNNDLMKIGVLLARIQWYPKHWKLVREAFEAQVGVDFMTKMKGIVREDTFLELIGIMVQQGKEGKA